MLYIFFLLKWHVQGVKQYWKHYLEEFVSWKKCGSIVLYMLFYVNYFVTLATHEHRLDSLDKCRSGHNSQ